MKKILGLVMVVIVLGCADRPWKPMQQPVLVEWKGEFGDLRIADDDSFATMETDCELRQGETFLFQDKTFCVGPNIGSREFRFRYAMEVTQWATP